MDFPVIVMAVAAGLCIQAALMHGLAGAARRPRDPVRIAFAFQALAVAAGALSLIVMYSASTPQEHMAAMKWGLFPSGIAWTIASVWLVAYYTRVRPMRILLALTAALLVFVVIDFALPTGLLHDSSGAITRTSMAGAHVSIMVMPQPHPLNSGADALTLLAFAFMFYAAWRVYRRGERQQAWFVAALVFVLLVVNVADELQAYGAAWDVYLTQLAFTALVIGVSVALRRRSTRTETELAVYRSHLESLVDERMHELEDAHARLAQESKERLATAGVLRRRVAELDALQHISRMLADRSDLVTVLRQIAPQIAAFLEADHVRVVLAASGPDGAGRADGQRPGLHLEPADGLLVVPLVARGHTVGALHISRDDGAPFSEQERRLAQTVAEDVAAAVENELLHAQQTREATEEERQRLARDLHDAVSQTIYSAVLIAEAQPAVWARDQDEGMENLARLQRLVRAALAEMRALLYELRPAALEAAPLGSLLDRLGDMIAGQLEGTVTVRTSGDLDLPPDAKLVLYRVTQEALSNILKHAHATAADVDVVAEDGEVSLCIKDDGAGFDLGAVSPTGMGLRMMRERLEGAGGSFTIESTPGRGTTVRAVLPGTIDARASAKAV